MKKISFLSISRTAMAAAEEKKADEILLLSVKKYTSLTEYFLIVTATSYPHIRAIREFIIKSLKEKSGLEIIHSEGRSSAFWTVLDYGGLIIHIMTPQTREMYPIERIWEQARRVN